MTSPINTRVDVAEPIGNLQLDKVSILNWLKSEGLVDQDSPLSIKQFSHGQSNPTYLLDISHRNSSKRYVLRKAPPGSILKGAHRIDREAQVIHALYPTKVPVPIIYYTTTNTDIMKTPFYLCEHIDGTVYRDPRLGDVSSRDRKSIYLAFARTLAHIHSQDIGNLGLANFGRTNKFSLRQVSTWKRQYWIGVSHCQSALVPEMSELCEWLEKNIPISDADGSYGGCGPRLIHGDYRLDNLIMDQNDGSTVLAVLDWELATLGDVAADLAYACIPYYVPAEGFLDPFALRHNGHLPVGVPSMQEFCTEYSNAREAEGLPKVEISLNDWNFYIALGMFRMASIASGVYIRSKKGNASNKRAVAYKEAVPLLSRTALEIIRGNSLKKPISNTQSIENMQGYTPSIRCRRYIYNLRRFVNNYVIPREAELVIHHSMDSTNRWKRHELLDDLQDEARRRGLFNLWMPPKLCEELLQNHSDWDWASIAPHVVSVTKPIKSDDEVGAFSNLDYAFLAIESGRSLFCAEAINCSAPDTGNMEILAQFGTSVQRNEYLLPLLQGKARSCFGMTEPEVSSSDPTQLAATAVRIQSDSESCFELKGRKWWTTGALDPRCNLCIFVARTGKSADTTKSYAYNQHSLFLVPMKARGVYVQRPLHVFGFDDAPSGHAEVLFDKVHVPATALLGESGKGFAYAQIRLGPGRLHHCCRLLGMGERALEAIVSRGSTRTAFGKPIISLGGNREKMARCRVLLRQAQLVTLDAANALDQDARTEKLRGTATLSHTCRTALAIAKVAVPEAVSTVLDFAIQIHGGGGLSMDHPLSAMWAAARTLRLVDGADEVHLRTLARVEEITKRKEIERQARSKEGGSSSIPGVGTSRL